jgi:formylglycine-generating enzyme required for sulfatase activity
VKRNHLITALAISVVLLVGWRIITGLRPDPPGTRTLVNLPSADPELFGRRAGEIRRDNGLQLTLVWCPAGQFGMGSPEADKDAFSDERPQVDVVLTRGFWLGQTEVTQHEWKEVMGTMPWTGRGNVVEGDDFAATYVSWEEAARFCRELTDRERSAGRLPPGWEYALPSEAQWEYGCRAGTKTAYSFGSDPQLLGEYAWWGGKVEEDGHAKKEQHAHEVGLKKANSWGLHDMHGNTWEWCADWYADVRDGGTDPMGPARGWHRVIRGGGWGDARRSCRSAARLKSDPSYANGGLGCRVALLPCTSDARAVHTYLKEENPDYEVVRWWPARASQEAAAAYADMGVDDPGKVRVARLKYRSRGFAGTPKTYDMVFEITDDEAIPAAEFVRARCISEFPD